jgi:hypothetical protein
MTAFEASPFLPTIVPPTSLLWPISTSQKHSFLMTVITTNILVNRMNKLLDRNILKHTGQGSIAAQSMYMEEADLWVLYL